MIDSKARPLSLGQFNSFTVPVAKRTAFLFNLGAVASVTLATLLPLGVALYWTLGDPAALLRQAGPQVAALGTFGMTERLGGAVITLLTLAPLCWGLLRLRVCFAEFALGHPFAARSIAGLRDFATGICLGALAKPIGFTVMTLLLTWTAPAGQRQLAIQLDSDMLIMALFAATVAALTWAMGKAAAVAEENSQFV